MTQPEIFALLPVQFTVYLARHATPDRSRNDIPYTIPPGPDLTRRGRDEAAELGAYLLSAGVRLMQASPLERTQQTARIAADVAGARVYTNENLAEWRGEETEQAVIERMLVAFTEAAGISAGEGAPVGLVSHGGPVHVLLKALGVPNAAIDRCRIYDSRNPISPAGAWVVERLGNALRIAMVFTPTGYGLPSEINRKHAFTLGAEEAVVPAE